MSGGRFAALVIAPALSDLEPGTPPQEASAALTHALAEATARQVGPLPAHERPGASVVVYDHVLRSVWRIGDCSFRIDDAVHIGGKTIDRVTADFRAAYLATLDQDDPPGGSDPGREVILPLLRRQAALANRQGEFGYGVVNGEPSPASSWNMCPWRRLHEVVLASDGYPSLPGTIEEAEQQLRTALHTDPSCVDELRSTKGLMPGMRSFDDRAWIRIQLPHDDPS